MQRLFLLFLFLITCLNFRAQQAKEPVPVEIYRTDEDPLDIAMDDRGIVLLTKKAVFDADKSVLVNYHLKLLSPEGKLLKQKTIYSEKNKVSLDDPKEKLEFVRLEILGTDYIVIGQRKSLEKSSDNIQVSSFDQDLNPKLRSVINNDDDTQLLKMFATQDKLYLSSLYYKDRRKKPSNELFASSFNICRLKPDASMEDTLYYTDLFIPDSIKNGFNEIGIMDFEVINNEFILLALATDKNGLSQIVLFSVNPDLKSINWFTIIHKLQSQKYYYPEKSLISLGASVAITFRDSIVNHFIYYDLESKSKRDVVFKQNTVLSSFVVLDRALIAGGEMDTNKQLKTTYTKLAQNFTSGQAFQNYLVKVTDQKVQSKLGFGNENAESVKKMVTYNGKLYILSFAFKNWPGGKYTKIYCK